MPPTALSKPMTASAKVSTHEPCAQQANTAYEDQAQSPNNVEVKPAFRNKVQPEPSAYGKGDESAAQRHGGSMNGRHGYGGCEVPGHEPGGRCVASVELFWAAQAKIDRNQHQPRTVGHSGSKRPESELRGRDAREKSRVSAVD